MRLRILVALFALQASGVAAKADPITVMVTDSAYVSIQSVSDFAIYYPNVTVTFIGDTSNAAYNSSGYIGTGTRGVPIYGNPLYFVPGMATIQIGSLGTFTIDDPTEFFDNQVTSISGIALSNGDIILATENAAFSSYTGTTSIGPLSGPVSPPRDRFDTSEGFIVLEPASYEFADGTPSTLTASVDTAPAPTPELSSLALLRTGILGFAAAVRRRLR